MRYMLLFFADEEAWLAMPEEERTQAGRRIGEWYGEQFRAGRIVEGGKLEGRAAARTVHLGPPGLPGEPLVEQGPFLTGQHALGAYTVIDVPDLEAALTMARAWPGGGAVEVRPIAEEGRGGEERAGDLIARYAGSLPPGAYPPGYLDELRDEWERL